MLFPRFVLGVERLVCWKWRLTCSDPAVTLRNQMDAYVTFIRLGIFDRAMIHSYTLPNYDTPQHCVYWVGQTVTVMEI